MGGLAVVSLLRLPISLGVLFGLAAVYALAARQVVLLLSSLMATETSAPSVHDTASIRQAALARTPAILASLVCTALMVIPTAYVGGEAGTELLYPMAVVMLGGLVSTLVLLMLVMPALYLWVGQERQAEMQLDYAT
jgi:Cu/Ag efflux pump CusA